MTKNFNINPYYDDFDEAKNFHQILFRPGYSVQARELTQIQSILKNQIATFGDHIFQHGSIVIPGNSTSENRVPYIKVTGQLGGSIDLRMFNNQIVVGETSGVRAIVKHSVDRDSSDPYVLYLAYVSGGNNGQIIFDAGETIHLELDTATKVVILSDVGATGFGCLAHVNDGVYYINGTFVHVNRQAVVVSKFDTAPSARVMLRIDESFVDSNEDDTLLDPAQGSYNYAAPGADRLKIDLILEVLPLDVTETADYIEIMRFRDGILEEHARFPKYNELEKSLARRTFDESGNYVVNGYDIVVKENKRVGNNNGESQTGDANKITYLMSSGKAYFRGFELESLATMKSVVDKARTANHILQTSTTLKPSYGQFLLVSSPSGRLNTDTRETIQLWNDSDSSGGSQIGTAKVVAFDYYTGDGVNPIYKVFFTDIELTSGSFEDIGSIRTATPFRAKVVSECFAPLSSGSLAVGEVINFNTNIRTATVALYNATEGKLFFHKHDSTKASPKSGDLIIGAIGGASVVIQSKTMIKTNGQPSLVFGLASSATKSLKNASNSYDMELVVNRKLTIAAGATTASISGGTFVSIDTGTFVAISDSGIDPNSNYSIDGTGTVITRSSPAPAGGITIYTQSNNNGIPRSKSVQTSSPVVKTSARRVFLDHADVFELISVVSGGVDIKTNYILDTGATDYEYGLSSIVLKNGVTLPSGNLTITYRYYNHTAGDFFTVDSYTGIPIDEIPTYVSPSTGQRFSLRDCIDFRKTVGISSNVVVTDSIIRTSVQRYMSRIDSVCIDKQKKMVVLSGTPSETPRPPMVSDELFEIERLIIPAYTFSIKDIRRQRIASRRYTMKEIGNIERRIDRLEEFTTLTAQEAELIKTEVVDAATGLDRFKTGYVVEDMTDPFGLANAYSMDFRSTMNKDDGILPFLEPTPINLDVLSVNSSVKNTGGLLTLPYTEKTFAQVAVSSRITNLNPFLVISWDGRMVLTPPEDIWVEVIDRPDIIVNRIESTTVENVTWVDAPKPADPVINFPRPVFVPGPESPVFGPTPPTTPPAVSGPAPASTGSIFAPGDNPLLSSNASSSVAGSPFAPGDNPLLFGGTRA